MFAPDLANILPRINYIGNDNPTVVCVAVCLIVLLYSVTLSSLSSTSHSLSRYLQKESVTPTLML